MYTIYFKPSDIDHAKHRGLFLTMDDCHKADTLNAGMLEQVLDDLISWHDVSAKDVGRVLDYISLEFGHMFVTVEQEKITGCFAECVHWFATKI